MFEFWRKKLSGVTGDFLRGTPDETMCPEVDSASESEYQGFLPGVKTAGAFGWWPTTLVVPKRQENPGPLTTRNPLGHLGLSRGTFTFPSYTSRIVKYSMKSLIILCQFLTPD